MKKQIKEIDEEYLKALIVNEIPRNEIAETCDVDKEPEREQNQTEVRKGTEKEKKEPIAAQKPANAPKSKQGIKSYGELFLSRKLSFNRQQCYVNVNTYSKMKEYLAVIGDGIPITVYIDNVLCHHMECYKEEINNLYEQKIKKPF